MIRITTLSENTATNAEKELGLRGSFLAEWGLSILIETDEMTVLLDTGESISATHNADILGIDLTKIDKIVLSHSHSDHTGGLREMLRRIRKKEIKVIAHPHVWSNRYNYKNGTERYLGMPFPRQELENYGAVFNLTAESVKLTDNMSTTGEVPLVTEFEKSRADKTKRFIKEDGELKREHVIS